MRPLTPPQALARQHWHLLIRAAVEADERLDLRLPYGTLVQRLVLRRAAAAGQVDAPPAPVHLAQVGRLLLAAWRSWVRVRRMQQQVEMLTASIPAWIAHVGSRRRLER